jgi:hypothetical protein
MTNEDLVHQHRYTIHVGNAPVVMMAGRKMAPARQRFRAIMAVADSGKGGQRDG